MKKLLLLPLLVAALSSTSYAQSAQQTQAGEKLEVQGIPVNAYAKAETDKLAKDLKLNATQAKSVLEVNTTAASRTARIQSTISRQQLTDTQQNIEKYRKDEYKKILDKAQYEKWVSTQPSFSAQ